MGVSPQILRLIDELKEAFGASISRKDWIDEEMTQRLLEKVIWDRLDAR